MIDQIQALILDLFDPNVYGLRPENVDLNEDDLVYLISALVIAAMVGLMTVLVYDPD